jgi:hypothetical protein
MEALNKVKSRLLSFLKVGPFQDFRHPFLHLQIDLQMYKFCSQRFVTLERDKIKALIEQRMDLFFRIVH